MDREVGGQVMLFMFNVRYSMPGEKAIQVFLCGAEDYDHAEEQFRISHPDAILVNIEHAEDVHASSYKAHH